MNFKISDGTTKDIVAGSLITCKPGIIPPYFDGQQLTVTKIQENYPFVRFYQEEQYQDENGNEQTMVLMDEESAVSPDIIVSVQ